MKNWLINDSVSFFLNGENYIGTVTLHKFFIDKDYGARLLLSVYYEEITKLDNFNNIDLMYAQCGPRDDYQNSRLMARIINCEIKQKWFSELVINNVDKMDVVNLYFYIKGEIAFINWKLLDDN